MLSPVPRSAAPLPGRSGAASFLRRCARLLASSSRLLHTHLEIWSQRPRPLCDCGRITACERCRGENESVYLGCLEQRRAHCRTCMHRREPVEWSCPRGLRLAAHPIAGRGLQGWALLSVETTSPGKKLAASGPVPFAGDTKRAFLRDLASVLSDQMLVYGELSHLTDELSTRNEELRVLHSIAGRLTDHQDLKASLLRILEETRVTMDADAAILSLADRRMREVALRPGLAEWQGANRRTWEHVARGIGQRLTREREPYYAGNPWPVADGGPPFARPVHVLAVGVTQHGRSCGLLALLHFDPQHSFHSSDIRLLQSLSEQVALAAANTDLYADLQEFLMSTVKSLVGAIEAKDSYTSGHSERVNVMSMLLGRKLGLTRAEMETLRWASILHDVGKIGMPEHILQKPGRLTVEEFEIIKEHPERGYTLLSPIRQLADAAVCVRAHHEMMDGRGYPRGLRGEAIPRLSRIIAVADTFDALTSTRSYRTARTLDFATEEIRRVRGTQLDPQVVDCFLDLVPFLREHQIMVQSEADAGHETGADHVERAA